MMLKLAVTQVERAMSDVSESVNRPDQTFTSLVDRIQAIGRAAHNLSDTSEKETIEANVNPASGKINATIVAFQFYDKLSHRLAHVSKSLDALGKLSGTRRVSTILTSATVEEALMLSCSDQQDGEPGDNELF
ncbi:hypothetical protein [Malonomonas rubra]|uniref:hypothetical protein n=1 Tax=Malonomonas rubra TaxID=57040 RepID=UPI0026F34C6E|nr:hypothetical protein [Malonomonas rubra]